MEMRVNKARGDDMVRGIDLAAAIELVCRNGDDLPVPDADIYDLVEPGLWVHYPSAADHSLYGGPAQRPMNSIQCLLIVPMVAKRSHSLLKKSITSSRSADARKQ